MKRKLWMVVPALAGAMLVASCSDQGRVAGPQQDSMIQQLVRMGFREDQIVDRGDHFVVEGDIRVNKADLRAPSGPGGPVFHRVVSTVASNRVMIKVDLSAMEAESSSWAWAARDAMRNWNSVEGATIYFTEGSPADITVSFVSEGICSAGLGAWPSNGAPGATITINRNNMNVYSYARQVWLMTHELGHNVGIAHHQQTVFPLIPGTPTTDAASVMNDGNFYGSVCPPNTPSYNGLSYGDRLALRTLYPLPNPSVSVSYPGNGNPVISWTPVSGASEYYVILEVEQWDANGYVGTDRISVAATTGTSATDWDRTYTGIGMCDFPGGAQEIYSYVVETYVGGKRSRGVAAAEIGNC